MKKQNKIIVIGGAGHIGLPLSLLLAKRFKVSIVDPSKNLKLIKSQQAPFLDQGINKFLKNDKIFKNLSFYESIEKIKLRPFDKFEIAIVTLGTPVDEWGNPETQNLEKVFKSLTKLIKPKGFVILRSTVTPGFTKKISKKFPSLTFAYCPERIAQGKSFTELFTLPQIIGLEKQLKKNISTLKKIFYFSNDYQITDTVSAELVKLFANFWRYSTFAISNQIYLISNLFGKSSNNIIDLMKYKYPRIKDISKPGLTAGPCLYKDTQQLIASSKNLCEIGKAAIRINEGLVYSLCDDAVKRSKNKKIIILGAAFKPNCDDFRDSLSFKIYKHLIRITNKSITLVDPKVNHPKVSKNYKFKNFKDYFYIIATPHKEFDSLINKIPKQNQINIWDD